MDGSCFSGPNMGIERIKTLKVIGENVAQIVVENEIPLRAIKIIKIDATLGRTEDHVFKDKVVKQGTIIKQVFFVDPDNFVRHHHEEIPFMVTVDIPGVKPDEDLEVQNHLIDIDTDSHLRHCEPNEPPILKQKVVAHVLVKVSKWAQLDVVARVVPRFFSAQRDGHSRCIY